MVDVRLFDSTGRKLIVTGHYGSGKTEFSVSFAMLYAAQTKKKLALIDLDIVNPYFRSRERRGMLEEVGVKIYGDWYDANITAEIPALSANVRTPLEDKSCKVIIDSGGNGAGALVLNQFSKYFIDDTTVIVVVNASRPETNTSSGVIEHIDAIETATGLKITELVNNTHLITETTADVIRRGNELCMQVCQDTGRTLRCNCYPVGIVDPKQLTGISGLIMPMGLQMRPTWLDK